LLATRKRTDSVERTPDKKEEGRRQGRERRKKWQKGAYPPDKLKRVGRESYPEGRCFDFGKVKVEAGEIPGDGIK